MSDVTTGHWQGVVFPADVVSRLLELGLVGSPFARSLTPQPTNRGVVSWPLVDPEGAAWVGEGQNIPAANLNDDVFTVAACKIATRISLTNESIGDAVLQHRRSGRQRVCGTRWGRSSTRLSCSARPPWSPKA